MFLYIGTYYLKNKINRYKKLKTKFVIIKKKFIFYTLKKSYLLLKRNNVCLSIVTNIVFYRNHIDIFGFETEWIKTRYHRIM